MDPMSLYHSLKIAHKAYSLAKKAKQVGINTQSLTPFYKEYPHADTEDGMRFLNIIQAGQAIEDEHKFNVYNNIPWSSLSDVEDHIFKHYCCYMLDKESDSYGLNFYKGQPPADITRYITFLERKYKIRMLK